MDGHTILTVYPTGGEQRRKHHGRTLSTGPSTINLHAAFLLASPLSLDTERVATMAVGAGGARHEGSEATAEPLVAHAGRTPSPVAWPNAGEATQQPITQPLGAKSLGADRDCHVSHDRAEGHSFAPHGQPVCATASVVAQPGPQMASGGSGYQADEEPTGECEQLVDRIAAMATAEAPPDLQVRAPPSQRRPVPIATLTTATCTQ